MSEVEFENIIYVFWEGATKQKKRSPIWAPFYYQTTNLSIS